MELIVLRIKDSLRMVDDNNKNVIELSRAVVKFLRKESTRNEISNRKIKTIFPVIDVETRWNSTFMMVSNLFKYTMMSIEIIHEIFHTYIPQLRDLLKCSAVVTSFKTEVKICQLILHKWNVITEIVETTGRL